MYSCSTDVGTDEMQAKLETNHSQLVALAIGLSVARSSFLTAPPPLLRETPVLA